MIKNFARLFFYLTLFTVFGLATSPSAFAQGGPVPVTPTRLYRFQVSYSDGGHLLTGIYQNGVSYGYTYDPIFPGVGIYVPPAGYTPKPSVGLVPLHQWTVIQNGWRTYYYYSPFFSTSLGSDYHYNGIVGYVFPAGTTQHHFDGIDGNGQANFTVPLTQLSIWYSQDLGYWNGAGVSGYDAFTESPPNRAGKLPYIFQGIDCALPIAQFDSQNPPNPLVINHAWDVIFFPPPPPPTCNASQATKNKCAQLGGAWDNETCSCQY